MEKRLDDMVFIVGRGCGKTMMVEAKIKDFIKKNPDKKVVVIRAADLHIRKKGGADNDR